ncbi:hypothetical protein LAZ67_2000910 [Cordylochernes scorpioides]|uniref:Transposase n=1 Tax=Cordylochernes scorpioides TaxID=51811 RepID=A0ABY6K401_9ARAC|nr:hypothetical protein LAZ67_2000910 [Cordylochernes scorpioides]
MGMVQKQGNWVPYELKPGNIELRICTCELLLKRQNRKGFLHRIVTGDEKWIHYDNPKRRKSLVKPGHASTSSAKPNIHGKKLMLCIWWDQLGVIYYVLLQPNETITGERYQQQLMRLSRALKIKRPLYAKRHDKVIYQHDNARPHVAKIVKETLEALQWDVLPHPLYSPNIAPSDYHMFRSMTHGLAEQHFTSYEEAKNWVNVWIASKDKEFFRHRIRPSLTQRDKDQDWISNWLRSKNKTTNPSKLVLAKSPHKPSCGGEQVAQYRAKLKLAFELLQELEDVKNSLNNSLSVDDSKWCFLIRRAFRIKIYIYRKFVLLMVQARLRRQREDSGDKQERELEARNNTAKIDAWLRKEVEKVEKEKKVTGLVQEKELKEQADSMLGEVRRKIQDVKKTRERLKVLERLREVRKHKAGQQGAHTTTQQDMELVTKLGWLRGLCDTQMEQYLAEEKTLCVLMETGQEADREQNVRRLQALFNSKSSRILQALFGENNETFDFSTPNEWPKWRKRFERYLVVSGMKKKEEADKIDLFMYLMGDRADDIFRTFKFEKEEEATKIDSVLKAFDSHFCVRKNIIYERAKFNSRIQEDREPVDEFITSLYKLADSCEFEGLHEQLIRDRIVVGVRDKALSERMQLDSELTLEKAVKMVRQQEAVRQQQVDLQRPSTSQKVNQVKFNSKILSPKQQQQPSRKKEKSAKTGSRCPKCGGFTHREGQACRAEGQKCNLCSKTGHFANCCPDKQAKTAEVKAVSELDEEIGFLLEVSAVEDSSNLDDDEGECRRRWTAEIQVNGKQVKFKHRHQGHIWLILQLGLYVETGSIYEKDLQCNIQPTHRRRPFRGRNWLKMKRPQLWIIPLTTQKTAR